MNEAPSISIPPALLRWLCVQIMATQRAIQNAGYISELRMQREIDGAEWEYDAEMERQRQEAKKAQSQFEAEADTKLANNPFLSQLRSFFGVNPEQLKSIDEYLKTVESKQE